MSDNESFRKGFMHLFIAAFLGAVVIGACAYLYPYFADPLLGGDAFTRSIIQRCGFQTLGNLCLMAGLLFADLILPGDYLEKISENSLASAVVLAAVAIVLGWINS